MNQTGPQVGLACLMEGKSKSPRISLNWVKRAYFRLLKALTCTAHKFSLNYYCILHCTP